MHKKEAASIITIKAAFLFLKSVCQLEGSDHGGRDSAAELALAGTIDSMSNDSYNRLTLGSAPPDTKNYTLREFSVNDFVSAPVIQLSQAPL